MRLALRTCVCVCVCVLHDSTWIGCPVLSTVCLSRPRPNSCPKSVSNMAASERTCLEGLCLYSVSNSTQYRLLHWYTVYYFEVSNSYCLFLSVVLVHLSHQAYLFSTFFKWYFPHFKMEILWMKMNTLFRVRINKNTLNVCLSLGGHTTVMTFMLTAPFFPVRFSSLTRTPAVVSQGMEQHGPH